MLFEEQRPVVDEAATATEELTGAVVPTGMHRELR